jgi:hypothetical protein
MKTTENHLEYWKRMKENARQQNTQLAFGFWSGVIAAYEAAQQNVQSDGWKTCGICGVVSTLPCPHHAEQA